MGVLERFSKRAEELRVLHILLFHNGELVDRADWSREIRRNQYSVSKSVTAAAVGLAINEGLLSLEERVVDAFSEEIPKEPCESLQELTVRDLLTMCMGQSEPCLMGDQRPFLSESDWVRYALVQPFDAQPNRYFKYSNAGPYLVGILVQRRAGCNLVDYLTPRLFKPLGIQRPTWETDPQGNTFGAGGLFLCVSELARFAQLHLQRGEWNGKQVLTPEWVEQATGKQVENGRDGYGYLFWRGIEESYRCDGLYGQYGIVVPKKNVVIAVNAECPNQKVLLQYIYDTVFPAL